MTKNHPKVSYISRAEGEGNITYRGVIFCHLTLLEGSNDYIACLGQTIHFKNDSPKLDFLI